MGSELSSFVVEPVIGAVAVALAIFAIIEESKHTGTTGTTSGKNYQKRAMWLAIAAIAVVILLIVVNILLTVFAG